MGPPSYMQSVVERNVVMRRMTVLRRTFCAVAELRNDLCSL